MSRPAAAGDEAAQAHYKKGRSLYNVSEYRAALDEFKQAYVEHEDPAFLYNIAQCHRQLGNYPEAITFYKRFLNESPKAPNRKEIQRLISELEGKIEGKAEGKAEGKPEGKVGEPPPTPPPGSSAPAPVVETPPSPVVDAPPPLPVVAPPPKRAGLHVELGLGAAAPATTSRGSRRARPRAARARCSSPRRSACCRTSRSACSAPSKPRRRRP
jgi:tetratricopeptide (TPR) repeat protein